MLDKETIKWLDKLSDEELIIFLNARFGNDEPQWEECSKKEYEKHCGKDNLSVSEMLEKFFDLFNYKRVPYWHEGGGILDQISGREPDGYKYYKLKGYKRVILVGSDIMNYVNGRKINIITTKSIAYEDKDS